jgi:hypothetical protein
MDELDKLIRGEQMAGELGGLTKEQLNQLMLKGALGMGDIGGMEQNVARTRSQAAALRGLAPKGQHWTNQLARAMAIGGSGYGEMKANEEAARASKARTNLFQSMMQGMPKTQQQRMLAEQTEPLTETDPEKKKLFGLF